MAPTTGNVSVVGECWKISRNPEYMQGGERVDVYAFTGDYLPEAFCIQVFQECINDHRMTV